MSLSKEQVARKEIPFSLFSSLVFEIGRIRPLKAGEKNKEKETYITYAARKIFERWVKDLRQKYSPLPPGTTSIVFRMLFPNEDVKRKYGIKEKTMTTLLAKCFGVGEDKFLVWDSEDGMGCLGVELKQVMDETHSEDSTNSLSLAEVDSLLDELASRSGYTDASIRNKVHKTQNERERTRIISSLFRRLSPEEACVVTQIILKDIRPLLYPPPDTGYSSALMKYNSASVRMLTKEHAMTIWDPLMLKFHRLRSCIDSAAEFSDRPDKSEKDIRPEIGHAISIPKSVKGLNVPFVVKHFADRGKDNIVWAETKYDGERAQIHVELRDGKEPHITIFSKSKRNSTHDRHGIHHLIRKAIGFDGQVHPVCSSGKRAVKRNIVLDAEMVACKGQHVDEFWRIRQLIEDTAHGIRARKRSSKAPALDFPESMQSERNEDYHLGLVFFDVLVLDDIPVLWKPYHERREILESIIRVEPGETMLAERFKIDMKKPNRQQRLEEIFQQHNDNREEGLVLKSENSYYNNWKYPWVKLKKDYIDGLGDTLDFVMLGAAWNKERGRTLKVGPSTYTTFYMGVLTNAQDLRLNPKVKPNFDLHFAVEYGLDRKELEHLNSCIKASDTVPTTRLHELPYLVTILKDIQPAAPTILLANPIVVELYGAGFTKAPNSKHYELRFPRMKKFFRRQDRNWMEATDSVQLRKDALQSVHRSHAPDPIDVMWGEMFSKSIIPKKPRPSISTGPVVTAKRQPPPDVEEEAPKPKRMRIEALTPPASSPLDINIKPPPSSPFTSRTNMVPTIKREMTPCITPLSSQFPSTPAFLTLLSPMRARNSQKFTIQESQVLSATVGIRRDKAIVWFCRPSREQGCAYWNRWKEGIPEGRVTLELLTLMRCLGWRPEPQWGQASYGVIVVDECSPKGDALWKKMRRLLEDARDEMHSSALPIYVFRCRDNQEENFFDDND